MKIIGLLIKYGADVNRSKTVDNSTPLYIASQNGKTEIVELLLKSGADINKAKENDGKQN